MKKLPYILYALLIASILGLVAWDYFPDRAVESATLMRAGLLLAAAVLGIAKTLSRTGRQVSNKKALYTRAYADFIQNVFSEDKKLEKRFFDAVDDYNQDKPAAAVAKLEKLRAECRRSSDVYAVTVFTALCLDDMQLYDKAAQHYDAALRIKPNSTLYSNMGLTLERCGRMEESQAAYEQALRLNPGNANTWNNMAQQCVRSGDYERALELAAKATQLNPKLYQAHTAMAISSYMLGDKEAYEQHYRRAVSNGAKGDRIKAFLASLDAAL